jgi:hypothetical protein
MMFSASTPFRRKESRRVARKSCSRAPSSGAKRCEGDPHGSGNVSEVSSGAFAQKNFLPLVRATQDAEADGAARTSLNTAWPIALNIRRRWPHAFEPLIELFVKGARDSLTEEHCQDRAGISVLDGLGDILRELQPSRTQLRGRRRHTYVVIVLTM